MLVYNKAYLDNLPFLKKAKEWLKLGLITDAEYGEIKKAHSSPYKSYNIFVRIGLFISTLFISGSIVGLFNLILAEVRMYDHPIFQSFFFGIIWYILVEVCVGKWNLYHVGVRGALLYSSVCGLSWGVISLVVEHPSYLEADPLIYFSCILPIIVFASIRYADTILSLCSFICIFIINALLILKMGTFGKIILPFEGMAFSYIVYYIAGKLKIKNELRFWKDCIVLIETAGLVCLYLSGNYLVVRALTEKLLAIQIDPGEDIRLAFFFYAYTIIVPLVYVWLGLKRKDYTFLRAGLILEVGGILAIKYYHTIMPPEYAMILGGMAATAIACFGMSYLKSPKYGITSRLYRRGSKEEAVANIMGVIASKVVATQPVHAPKQDGVEYGGGQFGGGGAGADY